MLGHSIPVRTCKDLKSNRYIISLVFQSKSHKGVVRIPVEKKASSPGAWIPPGFQLGSQPSPRSFPWNVVSDEFHTSGDSGDSVSSARPKKKRRGQIGGEGKPLGPSESTWARMMMVF